MKRFIIILCAIVFTALTLTSCMNKTANDVVDDMATMASEAKDNLDDMIDNGTVNDGDGFIDEDKYKDDDRSDLDNAYDSTEDNTTMDPTNDKGIFDSTDEPTDPSDFI